MALRFGPERLFLRACRGHLIVLRLLDALQRESLQRRILVGLDVFRCLLSAIRGGIAGVAGHRPGGLGIFVDRGWQIAIEKFGTGTLAVGATSRKGRRIEDHQIGRRHVAAQVLEHVGPDELAGLDHVEGSVVNYGLPALSGETASTLDVLSLEDRIRQAILFFEPRILPHTLEVHAIMSENELNQHNVVSIEIRGSLWAHPIPLEMLLRTDLDLETGEVRIHDIDGGVTR